MTAIKDMNAVELLQKYEAAKAKAEKDGAEINSVSLTAITNRFDTLLAELPSGKLVEETEELKSLRVIADSTGNKQAKKLLKNKIFTKKEIDIKNLLRDESEYIGKEFPDDFADIDFADGLNYAHILAGGSKRSLKAKLKHNRINWNLDNAVSFVESLGNIAKFRADLAQLKYSCGGATCMFDGSDTFDLGDVIEVWNKGKFQCIGFITNLAPAKMTCYSGLNDDRTALKLDSDGKTSVYNQDMPLCETDTIYILGKEEQDAVEAFKLALNTELIDSEEEKLDINAILAETK